MKKNRTGILSGLIALSALLIVLVSCSMEPEPIKYGNDLCGLCKMVVSDSRYGAEIVTAKGKKLKFDSVECMVHYLNADVQESDIAGTYVTDYNHPEQLIDAKNAHYLISEELPSPMGENLTAVSTKADGIQLAKKYPGEVYTWEQLRSKIKR